MLDHDIFQRITRTEDMKIYFNVVCTVHHFAMC